MANNFELTLRDFKRDVKGEQISIRDMLIVLNNRGFGAVLLILCLIELLPTGSIPGVPSLVATLIILISSQILLGRRHLWVPTFLGRKTISYPKLNKGLRRVMPVVRWVDSWTKERLTVFTSHTGERLTALAIIILALSFYPLELIPFASSIPSFTIAVFGISFVTKDGLLSLIAWMIAGAGALGITYILLNYVL
tara:strand:- start:555 stop:1139 length:585 start_codon:yes stop_codon:yes gene_type:complete